MTSEATERHVEELVKALGVLSSDVNAASRLAESGDTPFARRAYVRSAFALVEGNLNLMADVILAAESRHEIQVIEK